MAEITFEKALEELEDIVRTLEKGEIPLEESLKLFEKGITLSRTCSKRLEEAEKKVKILTMSQSGEYETEDWDNV